MPLELAAAATLAFWLYLLFFRGAFWREFLKRDAPPEGPLRHPPRIVAVIPARNEAPTVARAVASLAAQHHPGVFHIIVVDDDSTDGTAAAARVAATPDVLTVVHAAPLPAGWTGKLWALSEGIRHSVRFHPDYLLLTDADIVHPAGSPSGAREDRRHRHHPRLAHRRLRPGARHQAQRRPHLARPQPRHHQHPRLRHVRRNRPHDLPYRLHPTPPFRAAAVRHHSRPCGHLPSAASRRRVRSAARRRNGSYRVAADVPLLLPRPAFLPPWLVRRAVTALGGSLLSRRDYPFRHCLLAGVRRALERPEPG